nr:g-type lectin s-receptor-like serine/threonine-protein kinase rlk1 [Quercus suber]
MLYLHRLGTGPLIQSPSGEFAFGFYPVESSEKENYQFLLAVWFTKTKDPTIVWSANGNKPAPQGSKLTQNSNNEFVLNDLGANELWKAPRNGSKSSCVGLLDNGNLMILDEQYNSVWESFKEPTDTILPGQILYMDTALRSRQSDTNYSNGRFQLSLQLDGNLVLYSLTKSLSSEPLQKAYFATSTLNWESQLNFAEDGYIVTFALGEEEALIDWAYECYKDKRLEKLIENDEEAKNDMKSCREEIFEEVLGVMDGVCVENFTIEWFKELGAVCGITTTRDCFKRCVPNFALPSCDNNGWEVNKELVEFVKLENMDWPSSDYDFLQGPGVSEESCIQHCLDDCLCVAAVYDQGKTCMKKQYPLSNGRKSPNITSIALIKVPKNIGIEKKGQSLIVVLAVLLGSSAFLNILCFLASSVAIIYLYHKRLNLPRDTDNTFATNVRSYTYKELEEATRGFKQILGKGAFGTVYKGVLASDSKRFVAVKKLDKMVEEGEKEFKTEVSVIGQTHHKNLVQLRGYCDEGQHRLLVYEYMSNGSLATFLFGISRPHWDQRVQITFGISRGLMYLHEECSTQIIHCDIKPQNILLDECFTPRIADFGLAKLLLAEQTQAARTGIRGTIGYSAPEWFRKGSISVKVDVYSFGVMLLEIICCKSSVTFALGEEVALIDWAYESYKDKRLEKLIENDEEAKNDMKRLERLVIVAIWCIHEDPSQRPSMIKVTQMLEGVIEVSVPPRPSLYTSLSSKK